MHAKSAACFLLSRISYGGWSCTVHASIKPLIVAAFDREDAMSILAGLLPCLGHLTNKTESLALNSINKNFSVKEVMLLLTLWRERESSARKTSRNALTLI